MILRLLIFAGLAWLAWQLLQHWQRSLRQPPEDEGQRRQERFELTSQCARCGNYVPTESLSKSRRCGRCSD